MQVNQCIFQYIQEHLENIIVFHFKNIMPTVDMKIDDVFNGYVCALMFNFFQLI